LLKISLSRHCFRICTCQSREFPSVPNKCRLIHHTSAMYSFLYRRFDDLMHIWKFRCVELKIMTNNENN
jgi:hypothetical protein